MMLYKREITLNIPKISFYVKKNRLGRGKYKGNKSGRGSDGQKVRSGNRDRSPATEGGQFPLHLRIKKRGFYRKKTKVNILSLSNAINLSEKYKVKELNLDILSKHFKNNLKVHLLNTYNVSDNKDLDGLVIYAHKCTKSLLNFKNINLIILNNEKNIRN